MILQEPTLKQNQIAAYLMEADRFEVGDFILNNIKPFQQFFSKFHPKLNVDALIDNIQSGNDTLIKLAEKDIKYALEKSVAHRQIKKEPYSNPYKSQTNNFKHLTNLPPMQAAALIYKNRAAMETFFKLRGSRHSVKAVITAFASESPALAEEAKHHLASLVANNIDKFPTELELPSQQEIKDQITKYDSNLQKTLNLLKAHASWYITPIVQTYFVAAIAGPATYIAIQSDTPSENQVSAVQINKAINKVPQQNVKLKKKAQPPVIKTTTTNIAPAFTQETSKPKAMEVKTSNGTTVKIAPPPKDIKKVVAPNEVHAPIMTEARYIKAWGGFTVPANTDTAPSVQPKKARIIKVSAKPKSTESLSKKHFSKAQKNKQQYKKSSSAHLYKYGYSPRVQRIIKRGNSKKIGYIDMARKAAIKHGIDPILFVNQMANESISFKATVVEGRRYSRTGAKGIAQFMPKTGAKYGLHGKDFFDPEKALDAAAHMMKDQTKKYGSQILALVAYNGGGRAIKSAAKKLGKPSITADEWVSVMKARLKRNPKAHHGAWHKETLNYVLDISGTKPLQNNKKYKSRVIKANKNIERKRAQIHIPAPTWNQSYAMV